MPSRAFCILFDALPHALSAAIHKRIHQSRVYIHAYANTAGKSASTHVCRDGRDEHKSRSARTGAMHHRGTAIDGCLLQLTCERRVARTLRASRWRAVVECTRPVHGSPPTTSHHARRRERYYPVMDAPSVRHREYLARHDHVDETPSSTPDDLATTQLNAPQRTYGSTSSVASHSPLEERRDYVDRSLRKSAWEWSVTDWCGLRLTRLGELGRVDALWIYSE